MTYLSSRQPCVNYTDVSAPCATTTRICMPHSPSDVSDTTCIRRTILAVLRGIRICRALEAILYLMCDHL